MYVTTDRKNRNLMVLVIYGIYLSQLKEQKKTIVKSVTRTICFIKDEVGVISRTRDCVSEN